MKNEPSNRLSERRRQRPRRKTVKCEKAYPERVRQPRKAVRRREQRRRGGFCHAESR